MQICALDNFKNTIFALDAIKHLDYFCIECGSIVHLRKGLHRQPHFYHFQPNRVCRQHSKGMEHLMIQHHLKDSLPKGEAQIEYHFPSIRRIADVVWIPRKLVYEIQCSPISAEEVINRNASYSSIGYQVVWIFHDHRYNRNRISSAEYAIQNDLHYYSNMNVRGEGYIYDQLSLIKQGIRISRSSRSKVDLAIPKEFSKVEHEIKNVGAMPQISAKLKKTSIYFDGDIIDKFLSRNEIFFDSLSDKFKEELERHQRGISWVRNSYFQTIISFYKAIIKLIIERACR